VLYGFAAEAVCEAPATAGTALLREPQPDAVMAQWPRSLCLSHFEAYSAECEHRGAADAELHACLRQVAAGSRARFEAALEHVALHEGLLLPPS
jgi:MerR family transcriptional regulator, light-induced transcriptional regulator